MSWFGDKYIPIVEMPTLKELVKDGIRVQFNFYRNGVFYYIVVIPNHIYEFQVPLDDIGTATLHDYDKAITFMRWIRKSIEEKTLQERPVLIG